MEKRYIVIALANGDGLDNSYGRRVWSEVFKTRAAAAEAADWLDKRSNNEVRTTIVEDMA